MKTTVYIRRKNLEAKKLLNENLGYEYITMEPYTSYLY